MKKYEISKYIAGFVFETTASNTYKGVNTISAR